MRTVLLLAAACTLEPVSPVAAEWSTGDDSLLPPPDTLEILVSALDPGSTARITATGVAADESVHFVLSRSASPPFACPSALGGDCLSIGGPVVYIGEADELGRDWASRTFRVPSSVSLGTTVHVQAVLFDAAGTAYPGPVARQVVDMAFCPLIFDPVCGLDGVTYGNDCEAAVAGWPIAYAGPC